MDTTLNLQIFKITFKNPVVRPVLGVVVIPEGDVVFLLLLIGVTAELGIFTKFPGLSLNGDGLALLSVTDGDNNSCLY